MNNPESQQIVVRFFQTVHHLKETGRIKFLTDFTERYNIDRRHFYNAEKDPGSNRFQMAWLRYLVEDYGVSAVFLLTGKGARYTAPGSLKKEGRTRKIGGIPSTKY